MKPILEVRNLSKCYKISGNVKRYLSLRESITENFKAGFLPKLRTEFWALRDLNFDIYPGDTVGIIGNNGAGKSTLLKIISKITPPSKGYIRARGRVASLLEVGTGFHPELTGKENIFLNGAILGLTRREINNRFDEIIDFSGVEKFLDTPLKHYSSGMQLRLAFSVAAHLEPDILVVDEVLAVGDTAFQKKCIGKMEEVSKNEGRTVLFVSHNMGSIKKLCTKGILIDKGKVQIEGSIESVIEDYMNKTFIDHFHSKVEIKNLKRERNHYGDIFQFHKCELFNTKGLACSELYYGEPFSIMVKGASKNLINDLVIGVRIESRDGVAILGPRSSDVEHYYHTKPGEIFSASIFFKELQLVPGFYLITLTALHQGNIIDQVSKAVGFNISTAIYNLGIIPHSGAWGFLQYNPVWKD